jgi:hypothetical protein
MSSDPGPHHRFRNVPEVDAAAKELRFTIRWRIKNGFEKEDKWSRIVYGMDDWEGWTILVWRSSRDVRC